MSLDRLIAGIRDKQNPTVAGLDPKLEYIPASARLPLRSTVPRWRARRMHCSPLTKR